MRAPFVRPAFLPAALLAVCALAATHCSPAEQDVPLGDGSKGGMRDPASSSGAASSGAASSGGTSSGGTSSGSSGDGSSGGSDANGGLGESSDNPEASGGTSGNAYSGEELNDGSEGPITMPADFDPGDGQTGYYEDFPDNEYLVNPDGSPNGGTALYPLMTRCPEIKVGRFTTDIVLREGGDRAANYSAPMQPRFQNLSPRVSVGVRTDLFSSFLSIFKGNYPIPLGFVQPPSFPFIGDMWPRTYPFPECARCVTISTPDPNRTFVAVGGVLFMHRSPAPTSGYVRGRVDLAVFLEHTRANDQERFKPKWDGACVRLRHAKIIGNGPPPEP